MFTTCPCLALRSMGRHARVIHMSPSTLTCHMPIQSSSEAFSIGARPNAPPALLTRTSIRPNFFETSRTKDSMLCLSVTSSAIATPSSPATRFRRSVRRAPTTIRKPFRPSATAVAAPIPEDAPVMTATGVDLAVPLPPYAPRNLGLRCEFSGDYRLNDNCGAFQAYPRQNAVGAPGRVCGRPPGGGRDPGDGGSEPERHDPAHRLPAAPDDRPVRVSERAARSRAARLEPEDPTRARGGRAAVQLAAHTRKRGVVARAPRRGSENDEQRAGRALRHADRSPEAESPGHRRQLTRALGRPVERAAHCGPGSLRAARAAALQATLMPLSAP